MCYTNKYFYYVQSYEIIELNTNFYNYFFMWLDFRIISNTYNKVALETIYYKPCKYPLLGTGNTFYFQNHPAASSPSI
jgi:hypothetical protein